MADVALTPKSKRLKPQPPEAVQLAAAAQRSGGSSSSGQPKVGQWISKQRQLLEDKPDPIEEALRETKEPPAAAAAATTVPVPGQPEKPVVEARYGEDEIAIDGEELPRGCCNFCQERRASSETCKDCKSSFCEDCQNENPLECLGDVVGGAWQCYGCLNKTTTKDEERKKNKKNKRRASLEVLVQECKRREEAVDKELLDFRPWEKASDPPKALTSAKRRDVHCIIKPDLPEDVLVYKSAPERTHFQLPPCQFCARYKPVTNATINTAVGMAYTCGHAIVCKECSVDYCLAKRNVKCPSQGCDEYVDAVLLIQNSVLPAQR